MNALLAIMPALLLSASLAACGKNDATTSADLSGDPARGRIALTQYACHACHVIPGITGSDIYVGPPLAGLARRAVIAGQIPNTAENLTAWIRDPQALDPATAMPDMGVSERDARDIVAYLSTLE